MQMQVPEQAYSIDKLLNCTRHNVNGTMPHLVIRKSNFSVCIIAEISVYVYVHIILDMHAK